MNRAERRRLRRDLGAKSTKMKRKRPAKPEVQAAFRAQVQERQRRFDLLTGKEQAESKELWVP